MITHKCPDCMNFLTMKKRAHEKRKNFKDFTICFRFNLLSYQDPTVVASVPLRLHGSVKFPMSKLSDNWFDGNQIFYSFHPIPPGNGWLFANTFAERTMEVLAQNGVYSIWPIYKEEINANSWHSICFGFDVEKKFMYIVHNGKTQDNVTQPDIWAKANQGFDTSITEPVVRTYPWGNATDWHVNYVNSAPVGAHLGINYWPFSGYITDYHIFGHSLSAEEMYDITTCKSFPKGDIYSWDAEDWTPFDKELQKNKATAVQYRIVDIPKSSLCKTSQKFTYFPDMYDLLGAINLCRRFGGKMVDVSTTKKAQAVVQFVSDIMDNPKYDRLGKLLNPWVAYTDAAEFNVWRHYETGELPDEPLTWNEAEPNGGMVENCAQLVVKEERAKRTVLYNDLTCTYKGDSARTVCQDMKEIVVKLRGMCKYSRIDTTFSMIEGEINQKRYFSGNTGWRIFWDEANELWELSSPNMENMIGTHTEFETYPLGKRFWKIVNDTRCSYPNPDKVLLNMSPCNSSSFTCDDGSCIPMTKR